LSWKSYKSKIKKIIFMINLSLAWNL
jgi:hypothetical protein